MSTEPKTTEEKILLAAREIFSLKGYDGATTRDIAEAAGVNIATLHYYHRKKDQLFKLVAQESMQEFAAIFKRVFTHEMPLREKITTFVNSYIDLFIEKPRLAMFCVTESDRNPQAFGEMFDYKVAHVVVGNQLEEMIASGQIRPIATQCFITALVGMTIYPFLTKSSVLYTGDFSESEFLANMDEHRRMIPAMITNYLFID